MDIFALFTTRVIEALRADYPELDDALLSRVVVEPPRDPAHGDLSTNAAMVVAKPLGKSPRELAVGLAGRFARTPDVESVEVAGPGFINFRLSNAIWHQVLKAVGAQGDNYGRADLGK